MVVNGLGLKIFVTVGTQLAFDRLISTIDEWAAMNPEVEVFAQIGDSDYRAKNIETVLSLQPSEFQQRLQWADLLVAHAGMGSILSSLQHGKKIIVMPRLGRLKETRNDHQVGTALRFKEMSKVIVAMDENELMLLMDNLDTISAGETISPYASEELLMTVRNFINRCPD